MSQGNPSYLRFSLEESVWFQRGQEVEELVSISLDPNITIQENEQYVSIRGSLELTGEYTCYEQQQEEEEEQLSALKYVHSVMEREEGLFEFLHRFPVDITIPKNRIESIYDIDIHVEAFDYAFPEKERLKLNADLAITGLYGEQQHEAVNEEKEELEISYRENEIEEEAEADINPSREVDEQDFPDPPAYSFVQQNEALNQQEEDSYEDELYAPFRAEAKKTAAAEPDPHAQEQPELEPQAQEQSKPEPQAQEQPEPAFAFQDFRGEQEIEVEQEAEEESIPENMSAEVEEESVESSSSPLMKKKKPNIKKGISIAEFLARKEEETEVAKIRVCIVQQGDSLQSISDRYDVSVQQLLRVNHLNIDHEVQEGQVLYVPGAAIHQS